MSTLKALVVGAGGAAGGGQSGTVYPAGGGGGEVLYNAALSVTSQTYSVTVGTGKTYQPSSQVAGDTGGSSIFSTITARGGKGGGDTGIWGKGGTSGNTTYAGGVRYLFAAGGGAGDGATGSNGSTNLGGNGGDGTANSITGSSVYYGGGGGGGDNITQGTNGQGAYGCGGRGNTGTSANGVVILSWVTADFGTCSVTGAGNAITTNGADSIATFIVDGNFVCNVPTASNPSFLLNFI